jgi:hypothetical protein
MTVTETKRTARRPPRSARRVGYVLGLAINLLLLWLVTVDPGWRFVPFLTEDFVAVLGLVIVSLLVGAAINLVYLAADPRWLKHLGEDAGGSDAHVDRGGPDAAGGRVAELQGGLVPVLLGAQQQQLAIPGIEVERQRGADGGRVEAGARGEVGVERLDGVDLVGHRVDEREGVDGVAAAHDGALVEVGGGPDVGAADVQQGGHRAEGCHLTGDGRQPFGASHVGRGDERSELVLEDGERGEKPVASRVVEGRERLVEHEVDVGDPLVEQRRTGDPDGPRIDQLGGDAVAGRPGEQLRADDPDEHERDHRDRGDGQHPPVRAHRVVGPARPLLAVALRRGEVAHGVSSSPAGAADAGDRSPW